MLLDVTPVETGIDLVDAFDVTFAGHDGTPVRAWYLRPAAATVFAAANHWGGLHGEPGALAEVGVYPYNGHEGGGTVQRERQLAWLAEAVPLTPRG